MKYSKAAGSVMAMSKPDKIFHFQKCPGDASSWRPFFLPLGAEEKRDLRLPAGQWLQRLWRRARGVRKTVRH